MTDEITTTDAIAEWEKRHDVFIADVESRLTKLALRITFLVIGTVIASVVTGVSWTSDIAHRVSSLEGWRIIREVDIRDDAKWQRTVDISLSSQRQNQDLIIQQNAEILRLLQESKN